MTQKLYSLTVFLGDTSSSTGESACDFDPNAFLIDYNNLDDFLANKLDQDTTVYTSLGDIPGNLDGMYRLLDKANEIVYCPPLQWSDGKAVTYDMGMNAPTSNDSCSQGITENFLLFFSKIKPVKNFDKNKLIPNPIQLVDYRKTNGPQIWSVGCSITHGVGVNEDQRYGHLLAQSLNLPCSFLTRGGSAIDWASDQIIRSDIRPGDTVIWGITGTQRITFVHDSQLVPGVTIKKYTQIKNLNSIVSMANLMSENTFYTHLYSIERAINFCNKCQARLILFGILTDFGMARYLAGKENYYQYVTEYSSQLTGYKKVIASLVGPFDAKNHFKDIGTNGTHPGPEQHKLYADFLLKIL